MILTSGDRLTVVIDRSDIPDDWRSLAQLVVDASGDAAPDALYLSLLGLFRVMPLAWSDVLSEPIRARAGSDSPPELAWFRQRAIDEGVAEEADYEIVKVVSMLAQDGSLDSIRDSQ